MYRRIVALVAAALFTACAAGPSASAQNDERASTRASSFQPANLTRTVLRLARSTGDDVLTAVAIAGDGENGAVGTMQPGAVLRENGRIISDRQINLGGPGEFATTVGNAGHDAPALVRNADGSIFEIYGAASTYAGNHPPANWSCLQREYCEPYKFASAPSVRDGSVVAALSSSPLYFLPSVGLSEASSAVAGDATIIAGQEQPNAPDGQAGTQAYITYHATTQTFDSVSGPVRSTTASPTGNGLETLSRAPNDDAYFDFAITGAGGNGSITLALPGGTCTQTLNAGSPDEAASRFIATFSESCGQLRERYGAMPVKYDPMVHDPLTSVVGITARSEVNGLGAPVLRCNGSIVCGPVHDARITGLHRHYLFGGVVRSGPYVYYLMDVQLDAPWFGAGHNSYALRLACFRTVGAQGATWTWTDCAGHHSFNVSPGPLAPDRVTNSAYVVGAPIHGYGRGMTPYVFSNAESAQVPQGSRTFPVISAEALTLLPDGRVLIAHGCQSTSLADTLCYALINGRTGQTEEAGLIENQPGGGSLASIALATDSKGNAYLEALAGLGDRWGCRSHTVCLLNYRFSSVENRWQRIGAESLNAAPTAGFPGKVVAEGDHFVAHVKNIVSGTHALLDTISRALP